MPLTNKGTLGQIDAAFITASTKTSCEVQAVFGNHKMPTIGPSSVFEIGETTVQNLTRNASFLFFLMHGSPTSVTPPVNQGIVFMHGGPPSFQSAIESKASEDPALSFICAMSCETLGIGTTVPQGFKLDSLSNKCYIGFDKSILVETMSSSKWLAYTNAVDAYRANPTAMPFPAFTPLLDRDMGDVAGLLAQKLNSGILPAQAIEQVNSEIICFTIVSRNSQGLDWIPEGRLLAVRAPLLLAPQSDPIASLKFVYQGVSPGQTILTPAEPDRAVSYWLQLGP